MKRLLESLARRLRLLVARCVIEEVDDSGPIQRVKVTLLSGEVREVPSLQRYGFSSNPPAGAEGLAGFVGGARESGVLVAHDHRAHRLRGLAPGEAVVHAMDGARILLRPGGEIEIVAATSVTISAPEITIDGNLSVVGNLTVAGSAVAQGGVADAIGPIAAMRAAYNGHTHVETDTVTSPPDPPMA